MKVQSLKTKMLEKFTETTSSIVLCLVSVGETVGFKRFKYYSEIKIETSFKS